MRTVSYALVTLGLAGLGCHFGWEPRFGVITGVVRYPNKTPVYMAEVWIDGEKPTFTDMLGSYRLEIHSPRDTETVVARDGFTPGRAYAETASGSARVVVRRTVVVQNIVLDHSDPI